MSLESAINDHASAIRELAAAIIGTRQTGMPAAMAAPYGKSVDTIEADVTKVETDAKAEQQKVMAQVEADRKPSTAKEAIADALAKAKAEKETAAPVVEEDPLDATPLDYEKDVKPKLIAVGKDKSALVALLASMDVGAGKTYAKADQLPVAKFGEIVAAADAILAARG